LYNSRLANLGHHDPQRILGRFSI